MINIKLWTSAFSEKETKPKTARMSTKALTIRLCYAAFTSSSFQSFWSLWIIYGVQRIFGIEIFEMLLILTSCWSPAAFCLGNQTQFFSHWKTKTSLYKVEKSSNPLLINGRVQNKWVEKLSETNRTDTRKRGRMPDGLLFFLNALLKLWAHKRFMLLLLPFCTSSTYLESFRTVCMMQNTLTLHPESSRLLCLLSARGQYYTPHTQIHYSQTIVCPWSHDWPQ